MVDSLPDPRPLVREVTLKKDKSRDAFPPEEFLETGKKKKLKAKEGKKNSKAREIFRGLGIRPYRTLRKGLKAERQRLNRSGSSSPQLVGGLSHRWMESNSSRK